MITQINNAFNVLHSDCIVEEEFSIFFWLISMGWQENWTVKKAKYLSVRAVFSGCYSP